MKNCYENRKGAYYFIVEQVKELSVDLEHRVDIEITDVDFISLDELYRIKGGLADPSPQLVGKLKELLHHVTLESEIDEYLVEPFLSKK